MAEYRIRYAQQAVDDLDAIFDYICLDNPDAARKMLQSFKTSIGRLASAPYLGAALRTDSPLLISSGYRYIVVSPYLVFYCLFVSSDSAKVLTISNTPLVSVNLYLYCGNNPTGRRDEDGDFWLQALVGVAVQYASDVLTNVLNGETGADIFKPTSSLGTYIAAGVTAVIPGMNGFGDLLSNVVKEGICIIEKAVTGQDINWSESVNNVMMETANDLVLGVVFDPLADYVSTKVSSLPPNYSTYAGKQYKRNPNLTMPQIKNRLQRDCKIHRRVIVPASEFAVGFARSSVGDVLEAVF